MWIIFPKLTDLQMWRTHEALNPINTNRDKKKKDSYEANLLKIDVALALWFKLYIFIL